MFSGLLTVDIMHCPSMDWAGMAVPLQGVGTLFLSA